MSSTSEQTRPGRAVHPPLTDFPIAAYVLAAAFDAISAIGGPHRSWALEFWHAGTFVLVAGMCLCLPTMLTGFADLLRFAKPDAARTVALHVTAMAGVFMIGSLDIAWRLSEYHRRASTPAGILFVSMLAAAGVCVGAAYGGSLVFRHGLAVQARTPVSTRVDGTLIQGAARHRSRRAR